HCLPPARPPQKQVWGCGFNFWTPHQTDQSGTRCKIIQHAPLAWTIPIFEGLVDNFAPCATLVGHGAKLSNMHLWRGLSQFSKAWWLGRAVCGVSLGVCRLGALVSSGLERCVVGGGGR